MKGFITSLIEENQLENTAGICQALRTFSCGLFFFSCSGCFNKSCMKSRSILASLCDINEAGKRNKCDQSYMHTRYTCNAISTVRTSQQSLPTYVLSHLYVSKRETSHNTNPPANKSKFKHSELAMVIDSL